MKTKPILFSTPMVKAIMDGTKVQTRRVIKPKNTEARALLMNMYSGVDVERCTEELLRTQALVQKGDLLWVRETFGILCPTNEDGYTDFDKEMFFYRADGEPDIVKYDADGFELEDQSMKWKPSIFMPKKVCRNFLDVTNVRVEKLLDISQEDCVKEGIQVIRAHNDDSLVLGYNDYSVNPKDGYDMCFTAKESFETLWTSINGGASWLNDPFVFVYDFERTGEPENFL